MDHHKEKENESKVTRRSFLMTATAASAGAFLAGNAGIMSGCGSMPSFQPVSYPKTLLYNFGLFDGIQKRLQEGLMLVIEGDSIESIEPAGDRSQYQGYHQIDMKGMTLLPGLIDNHVHMTVPFMYSINPKVAWQMDDQILLNFRNCIFSGVTTVRDVGGFPGKINKYRAMANANEIPGPRVISSLSPIAAMDGDIMGAPENAPYFTNPVLKWILGGNYAERATNVREVEKAASAMLDLGAQWMKTLYQEHPYSYSKRKLPNHSDVGYRRILEIGAKNGVKSAIHQTTINGFQKGVNLGYHTLEHIPIDAVIPDSTIELFNRQNMAIIPTMMVFGDTLQMESVLRLIKGRGDTYLMPEASHQVTSRLTQSLIDEKRQLSREEYDKLEIDLVYQKKMFPNVMANLKKLYQSGATVGIGSDMGGTPSGFFGRYVDELKHFASADIPNADILCMATSINAGLLDMSGRIGSIQKGKLADIIAVKGNPLADIQHMENISMVMKGGVVMMMNPAQSGNVPSPG